jgi:hypothetical protein
MAQIRDWQSMKAMSTRLLQERTGLDVTTWNQRIQAQDLKDEQALRAWLTEQGVIGCAQNLLVWERFGYLDHMQAYVSLRTSRRTFARVQATTKQRVDLALRLEGQKPSGRLQPSSIHASTPLQISLTTSDDVDAEVLGWLQKAYDQNR